MSPALSNELKAQKRVALSTFERRKKVKKQLVVESAQAVIESVWNLHTDRNDSVPDICLSCIWEKHTYISRPEVTSDPERTTTNESTETTNGDQIN